MYAPLLHAPWHGLTPTDLIFPFFLFIVGISIYLSYHNKPVIHSTYKKVIIRALKLIGLGLFLNWFLPYIPFFKDFETLRLPGVLQRIGVVFLITTVLFLNVSKKGLLFISAFILIFYWILLGFITLPNGSLPTFDRAPNNWAMYIDSLLLGKHMWKPDYDPEGLLSTLPAIVSCISGILVGQFLLSDSTKKMKRLLILAGVLLAVGYLWSLWFPINKALWSSSFVLVTTGWATLLLTLIYYMTDIKHMPFGSVFKYVGANAIVIYFLSSFITKVFYLVTLPNGQTIYGWIYKSFYVNLLGLNMFSSFLYAFSIAVFYILIAYILFRKKIFIKV